MLILSYGEPVNSSEHLEAPTRIPLRSGGFLRLTMSHSHSHGKEMMKTLIKALVDAFKMRPHYYPIDRTSWTDKYERELNQHYMHGRF